jgi:hypothetical protein
MSSAVGGGVVCLGGAEIIDFEKEKCCPAGCFKVGRFFRPGQNAAQGVDAPR